MKINMILEFTVNEECAAGVDPELIAEVLADSISDLDLQAALFEGSNVELILNDGYFISAKFIPK